METETRGDLDVLEPLSLLCYVTVLTAIGYSIGFPSVIIGSYLRYPFLRFFNINGNVLPSMGFMLGLTSDFIVSFGSASFMFVHFILMSQWLQHCKTAW